LIFPHHECERAQSEAATGQPFVKHWMHVAMVSMDGHKMSKSRGNLVFVDKLRTQHDPMAIRLGLIEHHYRTEWEWDGGLMARNEVRLSKWKSAAQVGNSHGDEGLLDEVRSALDNDLDTPTAVALVDVAASKGLAVGDSARLLGVVI
jgi:L-cysteine:1D-myo-inositol 2-amino-2-deoxy-alpha-D-glucopyranoside ligase